MKIPKLKTKKKNGTRKKVNKKNLILIILISCGIIVTSLILAFALFIIITSPDFVPNELYKKEATVLYASDGKTEIARYGSENVELITYDDLPQVLVDALVATEDSRYFQHNGFDAARFIKASMGQVAGKDAGGASTISMQVIKNTYTGNIATGIKGIIRKFTDIYMAVFKLEAVYTKEEIIEFYLNSQWLGGGSTYYESVTGIEQGSQYFFGKSVSDLTLPEASLLVGMFNNPYLLNPYTNPEGASNRRSVVLGLMERHGYISKEEREFADAVPVKSLLAVHKEDASNEYKAFIDYVLLEVQKETGQNPLNVPMAIYTTLDPNIQKVLYQLENGDLYKFKDDKIQFGMAITSTQDGSVLALSGGRNYTAKALNRAVSPEYRGIKRQPGSTAKILFDYGPYIEYLHGSTGTIFIDRPWTYSTGGSVYNYDRSYKGAITMRAALVDSRNVTAVQAYQQVAKEVGADKIADFVHSLGIDYGDQLFESYAIGGGVYTDPLTMSAAYAAFGRGGYYIEPYAFTKVVYLENDKTYNRSVEKTRVMSEQTAYMITDMLITAGASGVGGRFSIKGTQIAAKGGTTTISASDAKKNGIPSSATPDHWNITYSPDYSIALWHGYDKNTDGYFTSGQGSVARKAIMKAVATKIYKQNSKFSKPSGVTSATVERDTYPTKLASSYTPGNMRVSELFINGYEPSEVSSRFDTLPNPTNGKASFDGSTITLSWDGISTPEALDSNYIESMYNDSYWKHFEKYKNEYYENYVKYNTNNIGNIGYQVYLKDASGNLISLGYTTNTNYTYNANASTSNYTFIIKSAYSIFKDNMSEGITINAQAQVDNNIGNIGGPDIPDNPDDDDNQNNGALD